MRLKWDKNKPTKPGAYWVCGFEYGNPRKAALVEVRQLKNRIVCNLHSENSDPMNDGPEDWFDVPALTSDLRWCGPLVPPNRHSAPK